MSFDQEVHSPWDGDIFRCTVANSILPAWMHNPTDLVLGSLVVLASLVASAIVAIVVLTRLPADYFLHDRSLPAAARPSRMVRLARLIAKNALGTFLILAGILMSLPGVPGQGLLTIFIGLLLVDIPGKKRVERWFVGRRPILLSINAVRGRFHRPPLQVETAERDESPGPGS